MTRPAPEGCGLFPVFEMEFKGDIHISYFEKSWLSQVKEAGFQENFWIMMAGGKYDFTVKGWNPALFQKVFNHFRRRIQFVQCGEKGHFHPPLKNVINLVGNTDTRQFDRLIYHADGVVCPVTFAMHLSAAVETTPRQAQKPRLRGDRGRARARSMGSVSTSSVSDHGGRCESPH